MKHLWEEINSTVHYSTKEQAEQLIIIYTLQEHFT